MLISLSGTQSVGKTTIINIIRQMKSFEKFDFINEIVRDIKRDYGVNINEFGNDDTQLLILNTHLFNILKYYNKKDMITDRGLIDGVAYTLYLYNKNEIPSWIKDYAIDLFNKYITYYDYVFYIPPEFMIVHDGERSTSEQFRIDVDKIFNELLDLIRKNHTKTSVNILTGSVYNRVNKLCDTIGIKSQLEKINNV